MNYSEIQAVTNAVVETVSQGNDSPWYAILKMCETPERPGMSEYNGLLADIAAVYGCTETQIDNIFWFGNESIEVPKTWQQSYLETLQKEQEINEQVMERMRSGYYDNVADDDEYCEKCGATKSTGAFFTTLKGQGICDDCV